MAEVALFIRNSDMNVMNSVSFSLLPLATHYVISRIQHVECLR